MKSEKQLYQWDVNQYLTELQPTAQFVDYPMGNEVIRIETEGKRCRIPDEFLQTAGFKTCYERYSDGTYKAYNFNVQSSPKPPDYVYTTEERTTFDALVAKADAAIAEIKRRADSGEFTPVKGKDYFTEAEKTEMMEGVSSGAVGEFRKVVDTATTEYNDNHNLKLAKYNANASEKLTTYDVNAEQRTSDYNRNAEVKLEAYNSNHTAKVAEYNENAAALQTEVDHLRGECDKLAAENRKQENRISALLKLNKGQTYDILPEEGETASRTAPSGAKYVSVDKVGGKSLVWNQLFNMNHKKSVDGGQFEINFESQTVTLNGNSGNNAWLSVIPDDGEYKALNVRNHQYIYVISVVENQSAESVTFGWLNRARHSTIIPANYTGRANFVCTVTKPEEDKSIGFSGLQPNTDYALKIVLTACDLTLLLGAGNEPTAEQFERMFPAESYPYSPGEIISGTTAAVELEGKNLWDDSNPAFTQVLLNAGFLYNSGVWHTNNIVYSDVNIGTIPPQSVLSYDILANVGLNSRIELFSGKTRFLALSLESTGKWTHHNINIPSGTVIDRIAVDYASRGMCKIKNIQLERGTTETAYSPHTKESLSTGFPELKSAGTAHDEIDMDGGTIQRNVGAVDLGTLTWDNNGTFEDGNVQFIARVPGRAYTTNGLCDKFEKSETNALGTYTLRTTGDQIVFTAPKGTEIHAFVESMSGATLYYELATPTTEPVTIPESLQEWLPVEAGGTVTFRNSDESKQLAVPNGVSWVRKLNEVE
nr:MAG TPA: hypothetical protein [Caudoviricetes sp.]